MNRLSEMNSFAAGLHRIAQLARLGVLGDDGGWFAAGIEFRVAEGWSLDRALTLAWSNECRARRDDVLCEFAARYCREDLLSRCAAQLANEIKLYERGTWRHDRNRAELPVAYIGAPRELLFLAFRQNESIEPHRGMPSSTKQLERILLSHSAGDRIFRHDPPISMSKKVMPNASNDGGQKNVGENVSKFDERRRKTRGRGGT
jgi:hypothetical protein